MIGMYNQSQPLLSTERIAGSISACLGFVRDGGVGRYIPNTVLHRDTMKKRGHATPLFVIVQRPRGDIQSSAVN